MNAPAQQPLVTIVVPCLNRRDWIRPTLDSIFAQTYPHIECIVMDGGSTDGTLEMVRAYGVKAQLVVGEDKSQADAINRGWWRSHGEILTWLNADDLLLPQAVSKAVDAFAAHPEAAVVFGDAEVIDTGGAVVGLDKGYPFQLREQLLRVEHPITQPASFSRRESLARAGWIDISFRTLFDYELWARMALVGALEYLPHPLAQARNTSAYSGERMAIDAVRIPQKLFANPGLPPDLSDLHNPAMSLAYIRAAWYSRIASRGRFWGVLCNLLRAFWWHPPYRARIWQEWFAYRRAAQAGTDQERSA